MVSRLLHNHDVHGSSLNAHATLSPKVLATTYLQPHGLSLEWGRRGLITLGSHSSYFNDGQATASSVGTTIAWIGHQREQYCVRRCVLSAAKKSSPPTED